MGKKRKRENSELCNAAKVGDVEFLREKVSKESKDYFLLSYSKSQNILHLAAYNNQVEFFKETMELLPKDTKLELLSTQDDDGWTPLHCAADLSSLELVQSIVAFYKKVEEEQKQEVQQHQGLSKQYAKPWLALSDVGNQTPLHMVLPDVVYPGMSLQNIDDCAVEILSLDIDFFCNRHRTKYGGKSLLFCAVKNEFSRLALKILTSSSSYDVTGEDGFTPLHYAPLCSGEVQELLLKKHSDMIKQPSDKDGYYVLHKWAMLDTTFSTDALSKFPSIRTRLFRDAIFWKDNHGCNALHRAAANSDNDEIAQILIEGYQDVIKEAAAGHKKEKGKEIIEQAEEIKPANTTPPWKKEDEDGNTPLYYAFKSKNEKLAAYLLKLDPTLRDIYNRAGESPLYVAVANGCDHFVNDILKNHRPPFKMLRRFDGRTVLHNLHKLQEKTGRTLLEKFWWMMNLQDDKGSTALDEAKTNQCPWLVNLLMNPSSLKKETFDWIKACKNNETQAVLAFIDNSQDLQNICRKKRDTPLHHIKLQTHQEYLNLLKIPSIDEIKNLPNSKNETPLYRALVEKDINLAKALLTDKKVRRHKTAMKRLQKLYQENDNWKEMCDQINVNPTLTTRYVQPETNLGDMRTTLSVVAALLATISFAAGFTLPGGLDDKTGDAILAKKAAFIVFLLADVYAMCTSMLVLLCLIWSMASNLAMSYVLVDRSVFILMQAVYGTMVAFMTGIYLVIAHSSLWTAIVIFVMCSVLVLSASSKSLLHILIKSIPATNPGRDDILLELEEGRASTFKNKES